MHQILNERAGLTQAESEPDQGRHYVQKLKQQKDFKPGDPFDSTGGEELHYCSHN
jgi:hypothetical protein